MQTLYPYHLPAAFCHCAASPGLLYSVRMHIAIAIVLTLIWVAGNFYLWALKQDQLILLLESLGMSMIAYPAIYWYVTQPIK